MDFKRIVLYAALFLVSVSLWNAWEKDYPLTQIAKSVEQTTTEPSDVPSLPTQLKEASTSATPLAGGTQGQAPLHRLVTVVTDEYNIDIDMLGGNVVNAKLLKYPIE